MGEWMAVVGGHGARSLRKSALLHAAADLFAARGYHAVSIDDLGRSVGISGPAVYRHFSSKAEVLATLCNVTMDHLLDGAQTILADETAQLSTIGQLVALHVDFAARERIVLAVYLREQQELPIRELRTLKRRQRDYENIWCGVVAAQRHDLTEIDIRAVVKVILSMLNGTAYIKDSIPRARLVDLLHQLAAGALAGVHIDIGATAPKDAPEIGLSGHG